MTVIVCLPQDETTYRPDIRASLQDIWQQAVALKRPISTGNVLKETTISLTQGDGIVHTSDENMRFSVGTIEFHDAAQATYFLIKAQKLIPELSGQMALVFI